MAFRAEAQFARLSGFMGGMALTENPPSLQELTGTDNYFDWNVGRMHLYQNRISDGMTFEWSWAWLISSLSYSESAEDEHKLKFIVPVDCRLFLGSDWISSYVGAGLQYNSQWSIVYREGTHSHYYDPWWGYYTVPNDDEEFRWDWNVHQLSVNMSAGIKILKYLILGTKFHFPIINSSEHHEGEGTQVDLSRDKTFVALTAGVGIPMGRCVLMINYEYPFGGTSQNKIVGDDGSNHFNIHTQSLSICLLIRKNR